MRHIGKRAAAALAALVLLVSAAAAAEPDGAAAREEETYAEPAGVHMSLRAGSNHILLNGEDAQLNDAPFLHDGVFYVPLREIAELMGGLVKYVPEDQSVLLDFPQSAWGDVSFARLWLTTGEIRLNGGEEAPKGSAFNSGQGDIICIHDRNFVPIAFFDRFRCASTLVVDDQAILYSIPYRAGIGPIDLGEDFDALDASVRERFYKIEDDAAPENDTGRREVWTDGSITLTVSFGSRYWEGRPILYIEVTDPSVSTDWDLRAGDSEARYHDLYLILHDFFYPEVEDGVITKLVFRDPHF